MSEFDIIVAIGAGAVLMLGVTSGYIRNRLWISEPAICLALGAALSPLEFELLGLPPGSDQYLTFVQQVARITLAISVMGQRATAGVLCPTPPAAGAGIERRSARPLDRSPDARRDDPTCRELDAI